MTYRLIITRSKVTLAHRGRSETFKTTGLRDPRIAVAIAMCKDAGYDIWIV